MMPTAAAQPQDQPHAPPGWGPCSTVALQCNRKPTASTLQQVQHPAARHVRMQEPLPHTPAAPPCPLVPGVHAGAAPAALLLHTRCSDTSRCGGKLAQHNPCSGRTHNAGYARHRCTAPGITRTQLLRACHHHTLVLHAGHATAVEAGTCVGRCHHQQEGRAGASC